MKKYFIIAAAIATMVSCQQNASLEVAPVAEDNAIGFSVYNSSAVTKGESISKEDFRNYGVGIFAFYQPAGSGSFKSSKFPTPDFMYNQKLVWNKTETDSSWIYSPTKYWPNNVGDKLSFFAYAPFDSATVWDDIKVKTDATGNKLVASFSISDDINYQEDLLWAHPVLNATNKKDSTQTPITYNPEYNQLSNLISFNFGHSSARVDIHVGVLNSKATGVTGQDNYAWKDGNTTVAIKSIVFEDLFDSFEYVYTVDADGRVQKIDTTNTSASKFNLIVYPYAASASIDTAHWHSTDLIQPYPTTGTGADIGWYKKYFAANGDDKYLFLAPQQFTNEKVTITYAVQTKVNSDGTSSLNDSYVLNVISKKLSDVFSVTNGKLVNGQAYNLNFLIGMDDVNITTDLTDWLPTSSIHIDVPANK